MHQHAVLLSIPGLRAADLSAMPNLSQLARGGDTVPLAASFPCVTCSVQASLTTGSGPQEHGVIANGFYWRDKGEVEMWTAWNEAIQRPQVWDQLHEIDPGLTSAVWFPMLSKGAGADRICTPAPIHNPDGSESLWCYTQPTELYGELRDALGHFPLMNFWGPLSSIKSTGWIVDSYLHAIGQELPRFSYLYLPHLDYAAQKNGPDSEEALAALGELDTVIGRLIEGCGLAGMDDVLWLVASEYVITPVEGAAFPNRRLREAGYLHLREEDEREYLEPAQSRAWAMVDHQLAHVFVSDPSDVDAVAKLFRNDPLVAEVLVGDERARYGLDHDRSGEIVLISQPDHWFAYYWWLDDQRAPSFARTVDIHRKPGYDPVELFIEMPARATPLDASLVRGSHGYPADSSERQGVLLCSDSAFLSTTAQSAVRDQDVAPMILRNFAR